MKQIVIDTNAYSFLCHGQVDIATLLSGYDIVYVPSIVLGELEAGFRKGSRYQQNKVMLERFLAIDRVRVAQVDVKVAETYGRIHTQLKVEGLDLILKEARPRPLILHPPNLGKLYA